jgi:hypothetical protein
MSSRICNSLQAAFPGISLTMPMRHPTVQRFKREQYLHVHPAQNLNRTQNNLSDFFSLGDPS